MLNHGQAVHMRVQPAGKNAVAVDEQVMGRDGRRQILFSGQDIVHADFAGDMLHDNSQLRQIPAQGIQFALDKHRFPIENVHRGIADFDNALRPIVFEPLLSGGGGGGAIARISADGSSWVVYSRDKTSEPAQLFVFDAASRRLERAVPLPVSASGLPLPQDQIYIF